jgi:hypothetical protein
MPTDRIQEIIKEIEEIQSKPYQNWISSWFRKIKTIRLQEELDKLINEGSRSSKN